MFQVYIMALWGIIGWVILGLICLIAGIVIVANYNRQMNTSSFVGSTCIIESERYTVTKYRAAEGFTLTNGSKTRVIGLDELLLTIVDDPNWN